MRKSVLTVAVGLALAGMMTGASAVDLTYDTVTGTYKTTKFISGNGELNIQTTADARKLISDLGSAEGLDAIRDAIAQVDETKKTAILTGTAGGTNYMDQLTINMIGTVGAIKPELKSITDKIKSQFTPLLEDPDADNYFRLNVDGGTNIKIGGSDSEPVLLATVGGDRVVGAGLKLVLWGEPSETRNEVVRHGDVSVAAESGNLFVLTGGSSAINVHGLAGSAAGFNVEALSASTSATIDGNVNVALGGHANAVGVLLSGSAIALGGEAYSTVTENSTLTISSKHDEQNNLSGTTVGVFGGGLAASTLNGTSTVETKGTTTIDIQDGVSVGVLGGGAALSAELEGAVWDAIKGNEQYGDNIGLVGTEEEQAALLANGGEANAISNDIVVTAGGNAVTVGLAGGGLAATSAGGTGGAAAANVKTGDIVLTLGDENTPTLDIDTKLALHGTAKTLISQIKTAVQDGVSVDDFVGIVDPVITAVNTAQQKYAGAHVGNVGGSIVVARMGNSSTSAKATAESGAITVNLVNGYNVATLGGGMTIAFGSGAVPADATSAISTVDSTTLNITGGDNVLVMAGGAAYATGDKGQESHVLSSSSVGTAAINMTAGSADGLFGGGLAIDDTNASATNASAETKSVEILVNGGTVNKADLSILTNKDFVLGMSSGAPSNGTYVNDTANLASAAETAIVGGGIATGAGAAVTSDTVKIELRDGNVNGNVFAGGAATLGGESIVKTASILVSGAEVAGDIYGGGLVGSPRNENFENATQYSQAESTVNNVVIQLDSGTVSGDIHAGGYTYDGSTSAVNTVGTADIIIASTDVFTGSEIDGEGAQTANLVLTGGDFDMTRTSGNTTISAFNTVDVTGSLKGVTYEFGDKNETVFTGGPSMIEFGTDFGTDKIAKIGTEETTGFVGVASAPGESSGLVNVVNGAFGVGTDSAAKAADAYGEVAQDAVLYLTGTVDLSKSLISVGSDATEVTGVQIGDKGILVADASGSTDVKGGITLSKNGIYFDNVGVNLAEGATEQTVTFSDGIATDAAYAWDNVLWSAEVVDRDQVTTYTFKADNALGLDDGVYSFYNDLAVDDPLRDRIDSSVYRGEENLRAGMNMAAAAGVQTAAIQGAVLGIDAASRRASLTRDYADGVVGYAEATGIYNKMGGSGDMNEMKVELGGVVVGGDYTMGDWTFGGLVNVGTGTVRGQGDNGGLKNEVDYYGFEAYAAKRFGTFNVVGHVGYTATKNDVTDSSVGYAKADDLDADVWSIGVRGEMSYAMSSACRVVPYVGINYLRVGTDGYTASNGVSVDDVDQDLFTVPVGAAFTGTIATASGWAWTPSVDIAYIGAFGDRDVDADVRSGDALGSVSMDVWSESVGRARVGLEASKGNFGVGVMAGGVFGSDDTSGVFGQIRVRYAF